MGDLMEFFLLSLKVTGVYVGGAIGTTLLDSWLESKELSEMSSQDTYLLIAALWPLYLVILAVSLLLRGFEIMILRARNSVLGSEEDADPKMQGENKNAEAEEEAPIIPNRFREEMGLLMNDISTPGDKKEVWHTGAALRSIVEDPERWIKRLYVTKEVLRVMERHPGYSPGPAPTPKSRVMTGRFYGIPVEVDPKISGFCFYWKEISE